MYLQYKQVQMQPSERQNKMQYKYKLCTWNRVNSWQSQLFSTSLKIWQFSDTASRFSMNDIIIYWAMIWHQRPLSIMYDILSLTNSTLLTADKILLCTKNTCT
jgi:hypothetical protein